MASIASRLATRRLLLRACIFKNNARSLCMPGSTETATVEYPPIKPKYPPGSWGSIQPKAAWAIYEEGVELHETYSTVKERLEYITGRDPKPLFKVNPLPSDHSCPGQLQHTQYITKTHIIEGLPAKYSEEIKSDALDSLYRDLNLESQLLDLINLERSDHYKYRIGKHVFRKQVQLKDERYYKAHKLLGQVLNRLQSNLALKCDHLLRSQVDEDVRVEAFWRKGGYKDIEKVLGCYHKDILTFQIRTNSSYQIRTEQILPEFVSLDDPLCSGEYPQYKYFPKAVGVDYRRERPISVSGHWIGDPCEFTSLSCHVLNSGYDWLTQTYGKETAEEETLNFALVSLFASTVAQAHNQGFDLFHDLTYPFTTQTLVSDGQRVRLCVYQLNTIDMWRSDDANPRRNLMWNTDVTDLFKTDEAGVVTELNNDVVKQLLQFLLLKPRDRGVEMRPYLTEEPSPLLRELYINHKGDPYIDEPTIGRFQYPRNSIYF